MFVCVYLDYWIYCYYCSTCIREQHRRWTLENNSLRSKRMNLFPQHFTIFCLFEIVFETWENFKSIYLLLILPSFANLCNYLAHLYFKFIFKFLYFLLTEFQLENHMTAVTSYLQFRLFKKYVFWNILETNMYTYKA